MPFALIPCKDWTDCPIDDAGKRLFKIWLCAPLREAAGINDRCVPWPPFLARFETDVSPHSLDAVEDILANANFSAKFDSMAKGLPDLERQLSRIHAKSSKKKELCVFLRVFCASAQPLMTRYAASRSSA